MTKAVFVTKLSPAYDDVPEVRYHFPNQYLGRVKEAIGDWIVYYEPRRLSTRDDSRGGRQSYFAMAKVLAVIPDDRLPDHLYALVGEYQNFLTPVSFRIDGRYFESGLMRDDGATNKGRFRNSVRLIDDNEFAAIVAAGFPGAAMAGSEEGAYESAGFSDAPQAVFERPIIETVISRPYRDAAFSRMVREAYNNTCAFTGLRLINGGGRPEVQAAHIQPVAHQGPDSIRNGLALSGTMHWLFDRGIVTVGDDFRIIKADRWLNADADRLFTRPELIVPRDSRYWPHSQFTRFHRESIFKG